MANKKFLAIAIFSILLISSISAFSIFGIHLWGEKKSKDVCNEYVDYGLFSSGYGKKERGAVNYKSWNPKVNCSLGKECYIKNIRPMGRFLTTEENVFFNPKGIVEISEPTRFCNNLESMNYSKMIYSNLWDDRVLEYGTGDEEFEIACYGIKIYASKKSIVDVFKIKYEVCERK